MYTKEEAEGRRLKNPFDTITEGIGINRVTRNFAMAKLDGAFRGTDMEAVEMARSALTLLYAMLKVFFFHLCPILCVNWKKCYSLHELSVWIPVDSNVDGLSFQSIRSVSSLFISK